MFNPAFEPEGFRPLERAAFLSFRCAKRGDGIFDKCQKPEGRAKRCSIPRLSQRVLGRLKERLFCFSDMRNKLSQVNYTSDILIDSHRFCK